MNVLVDYPYLLDIAEQGKKVIVFYKQKGGEVITPLLKALD